MERAVHQTRAPPMYNVNGIVIERLDECIDLCRRCEAILDRGPRGYRSPLLKGRVVNQFQEGVVEIDRCTTSRACGEQPSGVNEAVPECDVSEEPHPGAASPTPGACRPLRDFALESPAARSFPSRGPTYSSRTYPRRAMFDEDADLRALLSILDPKARDGLRRVLIRDQADRDSTASHLLRCRDERGDDWADIIDFLTIYPDAPPASGAGARRDRARRGTLGGTGRAGERRGTFGLTVPNMRVYAESADLRSCWGGLGAEQESVVFGTRYPSERAVRREHGVCQGSPGL
jgi:hypothetical protein